MAQRATGRDREEYARATAEARAVREAVAVEIAARISTQVYELIVEGDIMGGRALVATRLQQLMRAEQSGDKATLRAAVIEGAVAHAAWAAALDYKAPSKLNGSD